MTTLNDAVWQALSKVNDPELHKPLTELGMIDAFSVSDAGEVRFEIVLTTKACPLKEFILNEAKAAVSAVAGVTAVDASIANRTLMAAKPLQKQGIPGVKQVIAISSGKGGVGKSTVAVNIACAMAKAGAKVGILDADIYGPNVPIMMGLQHASIREMTPEGKAILPQNHGVKVMSISFLVKPDQALIWRGPILHKSIAQFFSDFAWVENGEELDYLLIDLPPGTGDAQLSITQLVPLAGGVIVTTPQDVSLADCRRAVTMFQQTDVPVLGVVENMSYFVNRHGERECLFGEGGAERFCEELNLPLLAQIPLQPQVRADADAGQPIVVSAPEMEAAQALTKAAQGVIALLCGQLVAPCEPVSAAV